MEVVRVKSLRESPRRPGRYLLELSNGRSLLVGVSVLSETGATRVGGELGPEQLARLEDESAITGLMDRAMDALARSRRTRRELELRLRRQEATPGQIRVALDRLEASGVLSDEAVAHAEAAARLRRGEAPARVRQQLRRKGVEPQRVQAALAAAVEDAREEGYDEERGCRALAEKRVRSLSALEPAVAERRLMSYLLRRGYAGSVVRRVARSVLANVARDAE